MSPNSTSEVPKNRLLPVVESFHSFQGEGDWAGTPMHFIRTAGCNVGQHPNAGEVQAEINRDNNFPILKTGYVAYRCHTYDHRGFWCDTDFHKGIYQDMDALLDATWEKYICITGGEPLLHIERLIELSLNAYTRGIRLHIETSGTIDTGNAKFDWICVSPKQGYLHRMIHRADEIKLLIDSSFKLEAVPHEILHHPNVFIQPINNENSINLFNLELCKELVKQQPNWRLSVQLHKCFNWR